MSHTFSDIY